MKLYPVNLSLAGRKCLVLGGGAVAERKTLALVDAGACVTVCSPEVTPKLRELAENGYVSYINSSYEPGICGNYFLVICATDAAAVNRLAAGEARSGGALVNVVDAPELSDFFVPARIVRGDLLITVSTSGKSPAFARRLREGLEKSYGPEYGLYLELISGLRRELKERNAFWGETLENEILSLLRQGKIDEAEAKIKNAAGCVGTQS